MRRRTPAGSSVGWIVVLSVSATAQVDLIKVIGSVGDDDFGQSVIGVGDVNGDGVPDFALGVPGSDGPFNDCGAGRIFSGRDGNLLAVVTGANAGDRIGYSIANAGDIDGDGFPEIVLGGFLVASGGSSKGGARVYSFEEGQVLFDAYGESTNDWFGFAVDGIGDVDVDGFDDIAVGAPYDDNTGADTGSVRVLAGPFGNPLYTRNGPSASSGFGRSIAGIGDASGDGAPDFAVGASFASVGSSQAGYVRIFTGVAGAVHTTFVGTQLFEGLGRALSPAGDFNGDSRTDLLVTTNTNVARIHSGLDGSVLRTFTAGVSGDWFGVSGAVVGDFDGDAVVDVVVGASNSDLNGMESGAAYVFSGANSALLQTLRGKDAFDNFGVAVAGIGDVNFDGRADIVVGANDADPIQFAFSGAASVFVGLPATCANVPSSIDFNVDGVPDACQTCQSNIAAGGPGNMKQHVCGDPLTLAGSDAILGISDGTPFGVCVLLASTFHSPNPAFGGTIWPIPVQVMLTFTLDGEGNFRLPITGGPNGPIHVYLQSIAPWVGGPKPYEISPATHLVLGY